MNDSTVHRRNGRNARDYLLIAVLSRRVAISD
jgi:hypothetical protein